MGDNITSLPRDRWMCNVSMFSRLWSYWAGMLKKICRRSFAKCWERKGRKNSRLEFEVIYIEVLISSQMWSYLFFLALNGSSQISASFNLTEWVDQWQCLLAGLRTDLDAMVDNQRSVNAQGTVVSRSCFYNSCVGYRLFEGRSEEILWKRSA